MNRTRTFVTAIAIAARAYWLGMSPALTHLSH
jgi:hypothetical protein